jgi:hypothetical protein
MHNTDMGRAMMYSKILQCTNMYISVQIPPYGKGCFEKFFKNQKSAISAPGPDPTTQESKQKFLQTPEATMPWDLPLLNVQKANCKNLHKILILFCTILKCMMAGRGFHVSPNPYGKHISVPA